jgi:hypothetical protein
VGPFGSFTVEPLGAIIVIVDSALLPRPLTSLPMEPVAPVGPVAYPPFFWPEEPGGPPGWLGFVPVGLVPVGFVPVGFVPVGLPPPSGVPPPSGPPPPPPPPPTPLGDGVDVVGVVVVVVPAGVVVVTVPEGVVVDDGVQFAEISVSPGGTSEAGGVPGGALTVSVWV